MASPQDMHIQVVADTTEFEISICRAHLNLLDAERMFWTSKLADAIAKRG